MEQNKNYWYGISQKPGNIYGRHIRIFQNESEAREWLNTEEYDFREREIFSSFTTCYRKLGRNGKRKLLTIIDDFERNLL